MVDLPQGTVAFLLTDVEGSSRHWEEEPESMAHALAIHDQCIATAVAAHGGILIKSRGEGDSTFSVFRRAGDAIFAAYEAQLALDAAKLKRGQLLVRMAVHCGDAELRDGDYFGATVNRCARLRSIGHGGQVLVSGAAAELSRDRLPSSCSFRDLGKHQLRDLSLPEHVFDLVGEGLRANSSPLNSIPTAMHNLPVQLTSFVGRARELEALTTLLTSSRLVTVTGLGGLGKTRVAIHLAGDQLHRFVDGAWLIELASVDEPQLVWQSIASVLGLRNESLGSPEVQVVRHLGHRNTLLVLDNCEHLVEACADICEVVLKHCPDVRILATSRQPLGVSGESVFSIGPLSADEALMLFDDRVRLGRPGFYLVGDRRALAKQLCARIEGIPLALELAAARTKSMGLEELSQRLDDRFRVLSGGPRSLPMRQQTLGTLLDWSHDLLSREEQVVFRRLGVMRGGFRLDAAEAICIDGGVNHIDVDELLTRICERSLITIDETGRYSMLETLREYATAKLFGASEETSAARRHCSYFFELASWNGTRLEGPEMAASLQVLDNEIDNLRAAIQWALANDPLMALSIATTLRAYWESSGRLREGRDWLNNAILLAPPGDTNTAPVLFALGRLSWLLGDTKVARESYEAAVNSPGPPSFEVLRALNQLGAMASLGGDHGGAIRWWKRALELAAEIGEHGYLGRIYANIGTGEFVQGHLESALDHFLESSRRLQEASDIVAAAEATGRAGEVLLQLGRLPEARKLLEERYLAVNQAGDQTALCLASFGLGALLLAEGHLIEATARFLEAAHLANGIGRRAVLAGCLICLGAASLDAERGLRLASAGYGLAAGLDDFKGLWNPLPIVDQMLDEHRRTLGASRAKSVWDQGGSLPPEQALVLATSSVQP